MSPVVQMTWPPCIWLRRMTMQGKNSVMVSECSPSHLVIGQFHHYKSYPDCYGVVLFDSKPLPLFWKLALLFTYYRKFVSQCINRWKKFVGCSVQQLGISNIQPCNDLSPTPCSCLSLLLRWGANPSLSDVDGQTALFFALCEGYRECVDVLLDTPGDSLLTITKVHDRCKVSPSSHMSNIHVHNVFLSHWGCCAVFVSVFCCTCTCTCTCKCMCHWGIDNLFFFPISLLCSVMLYAHHSHVQMCGTTSLACDYVFLSFISHSTHSLLVSHMIS